MSSVSSQSSEQSDSQLSVFTSPVRQTSSASLSVVSCPGTKSQKLPKKLKGKRRIVELVCEEYPDGKTDYQDVMTYLKEILGKFIFGLFCLSLMFGR